jgi:hypothetical protein
MTPDATGWRIRSGYANEFLLDREIVDTNEMPVGKVDDLEFEQQPDGTAVLTAILCGPTALGPRLGGRLGTWWVSIARRLRPFDDPTPIRLAIDDVDHIDRETLRLRITGSNTGTLRMQQWVDQKIVKRIPGGS